jgi:hypothetical protein
MSNASPPHEDNAEIHLGANEAIVLFELLSRWCDQKTVHSPNSLCFESTAECAVLLDLLAKLERQLVAPFKNDYEAILKHARDQLADRWNYRTLNG